ncbi:pirin family protein [Geodermatophilus sp. URMC 62]|uniref:pirin family protein n=1 Tax=Geodermatophilus sp. URMC 62 TaxID=3423414 RepID=UPI00406CDB74
MTGLVGRTLLEPGDGSLGPLLRITDDRLAPGAGYGRHEHRAVDVVAVVLAGSLTHAWGDGAPMAAGDVGVLRAGTGLAHDEVAGPDGARVVQTHLRSADPAAAPSHAVHRAVRGWVDLHRPDARLWIGDAEDAPDGVVLSLDPEPARVGGVPRGPVLVWQPDLSRPDWAD